jgi:DNA polymerase elongation subunit (family B)
MTNNILYTYQWHTIEVDGITQIKVFGLNENNETVYLCINDFTPYAYLELPHDKQWNQINCQKLCNKIDEICGPDKPLKKTLVYKKKLYYANKVADEEGKLKDKLFPFLCMTFATQSSIKKVSYKLSKSMYIINIGNVSVKLHESNASPVLQLTSHRNISPTGWAVFKGAKVDENEKESSCDHEYNVKWRDISPYTERDDVARPLIMSFDIEVNSSNTNAMPDAKKPGDKIFQISCIFGRQGDSEDQYDKVLLSLGDPDQEIVGTDVEVRCYGTEADLLEGYTELIQEKNPNIILGYNIFQFDIPYMMDRAKFNMCMFKFDQQSFIPGTHGQVKKISWSSSAYKNQEFEFLDCYGRLYVDALPIIKRDYNFDTYSLKNVSTQFLGQTKDPLSAKDIFRCYRQFTSNSLGTVGKYCVVDSVLVLKLFEHLQMWVGLCEMSRICNTMMFSLYTQGQQLKIFSQVYKDCMYKNYVVEKDGYVSGENDQYTGAYVFDPVPGVYDMVVSFDFSSLYPSTIIAYNIDYSTLVVDESIPDEMCNIFKWEDHILCEHDKVVRKTKPKTKLCTKHHYRFLKEPKGIIPTLLENLLNSRKKINGDIKVLKEQYQNCKDPKEKSMLFSKISVLDKRQLAMKVSANSMYGGFGVKRGYLPFMPGAMCTTARGRESIEKAAKYIQNNYGARLIYGDSVSGDTPILVQYEDGTVDIVRIDEIGEVWEQYEQFKQEDSNRFEKEQTIPFISSGCFRVMNIVKVWSGEEWSMIKRVIRHKTEKKMYRVLTHTGCVDVTEDHSLLDENKNKIKPTDISLGSKLYHSFPPNEDFLEVEIKDAVIEGKVKECKQCKTYKLIFEFYDEENCRECLDTTLKYFSETEYLRNPCKNLDKDLAFVWGLFMSKGCCNDVTWAIDNINEEISSKTIKILQTHEPMFEWKSLHNDHEYIVKKWRRLFYDREGYKKVPYFILNSSDDIKQSFFDGYYEGDGDKHTYNKIKQYKFDIKGKIGANGLFVLLTSLGYKVGINTKDSKVNIYTLHTCKYFRKEDNAVKKIIHLPDCNTEEYVYDIETDNGRFLGGIGKMILKNTDSCYVNFPQFKSEKEAKECYEFCRNVEEEMLTLFPKPMKLAYEEKIYWRFFILTKKRYMALQCNQQGVISNNIFKRGVLLARRDSNKILRNIYSELMMKIFYREEQNSVLQYVVDKIVDMFCCKYNKKDFVSTKSVGKTEDYKVRPLSDDPKKKEKRLADLNCTEEEYILRSLPAHIQLAQRMKRRGKRVDPGTRLEYVITSTGGIDANLFDKIEELEYFLDNSDILKIDFFYYLNLFINSLDQAIETAYGIKNFIKTQYTYHVRKEKVMDRIRNMSKAKIILA